uniref:CCHC-type domain-containing protein n=1 Tax=Meloidogyne floridensis TaxID=298350 RepID=A0A915NMX9_9BILA
LPTEPTCTTVVLEPEEEAALDESNAEELIDVPGYSHLNKEIVVDSPQVPNEDEEPSHQDKGGYNLRRNPKKKRYVFSNHFDCIFVVDGVTFHSSESYYMYYKALLSNNYEIAEQILNLKSAAMIKKLGSNLPGHNTKKWRKICILVMSIANWYKYNQNPELKRILLSTRGILLVEASRSDQYWACGLEMHSKDIVDKKKWREMSAERLNIASLEEFPPLGTSTKKVILSKPSLPSSSQSDSVVVPMSVEKSAPMVDTLTENTKRMSLEHGEVEESVKSSGESLRGNKNSFEKKVIEYIVVQVGENDVIGARLNQKSNFSWPCFVSIANKIAENSEGFSNKLQLGDRVFISDFQWRVGFEILARNEFEVTQNRRNWNVGRINPQAIIKEIEFIHHANRRDFPGVIISLKRGGKYNSLLCCLVISAGLQVCSKCYRRQLVDLDLDELEIGQLVTVSVAEIPEQCLVDESYLLPPQSEFKMGSEEMIRDDFGVLGTVRSHLPWHYKREGKNVFYPLVPQMSIEEVELCESIISAAIAYSFEDERKKIIENRFEGAALYWDKQFYLKFSEIDSMKVKNLKMIRVLNVQERKNRDTEEEFLNAQDGGLLVAHPIIIKGSESRRTCFSANMPSRLSELDTKQGQLMKALLAREVEIVELDDVYEPLNPHPLMRLLNERQKETVNSLLSGGCKLVYQQAPPGVGKTFCAAVVTAILLHSLTNAKIAIITSANLPLAKLAKELENVLSPEEMEESKAITFFSGFAKDRYKEMINELRRHMLITKLKLEEISEKFDNNAKQDVKEYCENFESRPRLTSEVKLGSMLSEIVNLKIVFSTAAMAENMVYSSLLDTTVLIVDEATQTSFAEITNLVARLPNLEKILITGDKFQIGTHLQDLPKSLHDGFGLDSIVPQLLISPSVHQTRLSVCYRMHPLLVQCVSYAAYEIHNEPLEPGRSADERALLTNSRFPLPIQSCPIILLNVVGSCRQDVVSHSLTNDLQTTSVVKLVSSLYEYISPEVNVVVICLYLFQKECLQVEFEKLGYNVLTVSVDGYQSMEADLIVLVTTRSHSNDSNLADSSEFFSDENRSTVALSRSKHGLFLVGDIELLKSGRVWSRFIEKATEFTSVVGTNYLNILQSGRVKRDRFGQILSMDGLNVSESVEKFNFQNRSNDSWRNDGQGTSSGNRKRPFASNNWKMFSGKTFVRSEQRSCYNCGQYGHISKDCNSWRGGRGKPF